MGNISVTLVSVRELWLLMFLGEFEHCIDSKNRLRIPPKFRKNMPNGMILTKGSNGCLFLMQKQYFDKLIERLDNISMFDDIAQRPLRFLLSSAIEVEEDNQGRFLLPISLKNYCEITKDIISIGVGNRVEIWSKENWGRYNSQNANSFDEVVKGLKDYGI